MMVEHLKQQGTSHSSRDLLKICVKMGASWSAQTFRQAGKIPSGPESIPRFLFSEDPVHILYTDLKHRLRGEGRRDGGCRGVGTDQV